MDTPVDSHLSTEDVAAYLSRAVSDEERRRVERHLVQCGPCCDELVAHGYRLSEGRRSPWPLVASAGLAAAAVLAGVLLLGPRLGVLLSDEEPVFRGAQAPVEETLRPAIEAVAPEDEGAVAKDSVVFVWHPVDADALYSLTLTDGEGSLIWRGTTRDTLLALAPDVRLRDGDQYYWYVDALLATGESPSTGVRRFTAR